MLVKPIQASGASQNKNRREGALAFDFGCGSLARGSFPEWQVLDVDTGICIFQWYG